MELIVPNIISKDTPILTYYDMDIQQHYNPNDIKSHGKKLYKKPFNFNELIGEYLAREKGLKTAQYFIYYNIPRNIYHIASIDFKEEDKNYYNLENVPISYQKDTILEDLVTKKETGEINEVFLDHLLTMFALDYYMLQHDRDTKNYYLEQDKDGNFDLGPLYDYSDSLDSTCYYHYDKVDLNTYYHYYNNGIITLDTQDDFDQLIEKYPIFKDKLKDMANTSVIEIVNQIEQDFSLNIGNEARDSYKRDEENSRKILTKILR